MAAATVAKTRKRPRRAQPAPQAGVQRYRFTPDQFEQLARLGLFDQQRVELIAGEIVQMPPIGPEHGSTVDQTMQSLGRRLPAKPYYLRVQNPLRLGDSEPVPDVAIVPGKPSDYRTHHPTTALLVIEIADTSLEYDRTEKMSLYARRRHPRILDCELGGAVRGGLSGACVACGRARRSTRGIVRCGIMGWMRWSRRCLSRRWRYLCGHCLRARSRR
jgi:hypothetical protein